LISHTEYNVFTIFENKNKEQIKELQKGLNIYYIEMKIQQILSNYIFFSSSFSFLLLIPASNTKEELHKTTIQVGSQRLKRHC
jgi:hypothetical protein